MSDFAAEFAAAGAWIDRYLAGARDYPVLSKVAPGDVAASLPARAPEHGEPFDALLADFQSLILPGITHWNSPRFFAYFATSGAPVGVTAEALAAALDVKAMLWRTSPAATELEEVVMRWLAQLIGLPDDFTGIIYDTASIGGFTALAAARESLELDIRDKGMAARDLPRLRVYLTSETHSHIEKACIALGIGRDNAVRVETDEEFRMRPDALKRHIEEDVAAGMRPMAVVATVGTTATTSCDPLREIGAIARARKLWVHVDAAYAGIAAILPEFRSILDGIEFADSMVVNPHKWLFVPMDCSALYVRDPELLRRAFSIVPEFVLQHRDLSAGTNFMEYGLQLGRRFRALKLWFVLRYYGAEGIREHLRRHIALAQEFAGWVEAEPDWEIAAPHPFSVVCFRYAPPGMDQTQIEALNTQILDRVNATGKVFLSHAKISGRYALRLAIGNIATTRDDVALAWQLLRDEAGAVSAQVV